MKKLRALLLAVVLIAGCKRDQLDFDQSLVLSPSYIIPVATLNMSLGDWAGDGIEEDSTGALKVVYQEDSIIDPIRVSDFIDIPDGIGFDAVDFPLLNPEVAPFVVTGTTSLDQASTGWDPVVRNALVAADGTNAIFPPFVNESGGQTLFSVPSNFSNGIVSEITFDLTLTNSWPVDLQNVVVTLTSNSFTQATWTFMSVTAGGTATETFSLPGGSLDNSFTLDIVSMSSTGSSSMVPIDLTDLLSWSLDVNNIFMLQGDADMVPQTILDSSSVLDFNFTNGEEVVLLELLSGQIDYDLTSSMQRPTEIIIEFFGSTDANGDPLEAVLPMTPNANSTGTVDLSGASLRMDNDPSQPYNRLDLGFQFKIASSDGSIIPIDTAQNIEGTIFFNGLEFEYLEGYFGQVVEDLTGTAVELDIDFLNQFGGSFEFQDPILNILTTNGVGAPIRTNFDMDGTSSDGNLVSLGMPDSDIAYPDFTQVGQNIEGVIVVDRDNSNIVNFLSNIPTTIDINGSVDINPDGNVGDNFIFRESLVNVGLRIDVGLNLKADGLTLTDTIEAGFSLEDDSPADPQTISLFINVDNGIGLDGNAFLIFTDSLFNPIDSVQTELLDAAVVDADGFVVSSTFKENVIELDEAQTDAFFNSERILVRTVLSTPQNGNQNYVMTTSDAMTMYLAISSKVNLEINGN